MLRHRSQSRKPCGQPTRDLLLIRLGKLRPNSGTHPRFRLFKQLEALHESLFRRHRASAHHLLDEELVDQRLEFVRGIHVTHFNSVRSAKQEDATAALFIEP